MAIAAGFGSSGLAEWIGGQMSVLEGVNFLLVILLATGMVLFLTEITSNTATATMILPVLASLALALDIHPFVLMVPAPWPPTAPLCCRWHPAQRHYLCHWQAKNHRDGAYRLLDQHHRHVADCGSGVFPSADYVGG